jgi:predicted DCC family thiol-disulfide oxidoreductase YuxK/protein-S-isoprenylcysteine O-methyltransferase Ste14
MNVDNVIRGLLLSHFTVFRVALFACCIGYAAILHGWLRPDAVRLRRGILAVVVQLWIGLWGDLVCLRIGAWSYRALPFSMSGIPIDLHVDWALLWGLGLVWLSDRWPGRGARASSLAVYLALWTALTVFFDATTAHWLLFLDAHTATWWLADLVFLVTVQGLTLWFYLSIGSDTDGASIPLIGPYARSLTYVSIFVPFFFFYLPEQVDEAARRFGFRVGARRVPVVPELLALGAVALGGWAIHEFARRGRGTPVPWDPPDVLVDSGPYAFVANPMQISGVLFTSAALLWHLSWTRALYLVDVVVTVGAVFDILEPEGLTQRFGDAYVEYRRDVALWRFRLVPYRRPARARRPVLRFDGECGLCQALVAAVLTLDRGHALRVAPLKPLTDSDADDGHAPADRCDAGRMLLLEPGPRPEDPALTSHGVRALLRVYALSPMPWCFMAAWEGVPGVCRLGDVAYGVVARRRRRWFPASRDLQAHIEADPRYEGT